MLMVDSRLILDCWLVIQQKFFLGSIVDQWSNIFFEWVFAKKQTPGYFPSFIPKSWVSWSAHRGRSLAGATCTCCYATPRSDLYLKDSESGDWPSYGKLNSYQKIYRESDDGQQWDAMAMGVPDFPTWRTIPSGMIQKGHRCETASGGICQRHTPRWKNAADFQVCERCECRGKWLNYAENYLRLVGQASEFHCLGVRYKSHQGFQRGWN